MKLNRKVLLFFATLLLLISKLYGQHKPTVMITVEGNHENLCWSIAGNLKGTSPNILSEINWRRIRSLGYSGEIRMPLWNRFSLLLTASQAFTIRGTVTDADYQKDDKTGIVFFAKEDASKGRSGNLSSSILYQVVILGNARFYAGAGYGLLNQHLFLVNNLNGLNSKYTNHWYGPLITTKASVAIFKKVHFDLQVIYHQINYKATGNWNLIEEFEHPESFSHIAKGLGLENLIFVKYVLHERLRLAASFKYSYWSTGKGIDKLYKKDAASVKTRLNDVTRNQLGFGIGVAYNFP